MPPPESYSLDELRKLQYSAQHDHQEAEKRFRRLQKAQQEAEDETQSLRERRAFHKDTQSELHEEMLAMESKLAEHRKLIRNAEVKERHAQVGIDRAIEEVALAKRRKEDAAIDWQEALKKKHSRKASPRSNRSLIM